MTENLHARAQRLFSEAAVEGISIVEQTWLDAHLRECADCARQAEVARELLSALRSLPVAVPRDLASRTQLRLRLRAQQAEQTSSSGALLWIITAASWLLRAGMSSGRPQPRHHPKRAPAALGVLYRYA